jgi:DNA-binding response OmpR family regulator
MKTKILFFDDERRIAEVLQKNLELYDYEVTLVSTIGDFFVEINNLAITYDLIIMDIMAPLPDGNDVKWFSESEINNMDGGIRSGEVIADKIRNSNEPEYVAMNLSSSIGEVLADKIRGIVRYANVPILFYSAKGSVKSFSNAIYLSKPTLARDIVKEISVLLKNKA